MTTGPSRTDRVREPGGTRSRRLPPRWPAAIAVAAAALAAAGCGRNGEDALPRASGYVEATEVRVAPEVGGRVLEVAVEEGQRVESGAVIARLDTADAQLALTRARAERDQAVAQLKLL